MERSLAGISEEDTTEQGAQGAQTSEPAVNFVQSSSVKNLLLGVCERRGGGEREREGDRDEMRISCDNPILRAPESYKLKAKDIHIVCVCVRESVCINDTRALACMCVCVY